MKTVISFLTFGAASFFMWTTADGVVSFTDNESRIPAMYRPVAIEREWVDVRDQAWGTLFVPKD